MVFLLKCLVTVFLNPQPLTLPKYVLNLKSNSAPPKFQSGPTEFIQDLATAKP